MHSFTFVQIHEIVTSVYNDRRVNEFLSKQEPADLRDDLKHHCVMEIYRMNAKYPGKIEALYQEGKMFAFFVGMVRNQLHSEKSTFFTRFRRHFEPEEAYLHIADKLPDTVQDQDETEAVAKFGAGFIDYFYKKFAERGQKRQIANVQMSMF